MKHIRMIFAAMLLAVMAMAPQARAAVDAAVCSASDQAGCTGTNLKTNTTEELAALSNRATFLLASVSGTNTITACTTPTITSYVDGMRLAIKPAADNTGAVTLNVCSVAAKAVVTASGAALSSGHLLTSTTYELRWYASGDHWRVMNLPAAAPPTYLTKISGASGTAGSYITSQLLTSDASANSTTTLTSVMATTTPAAGTYTFKYTIIYQSAATTTGIGFALNYTGTTTKYVSAWRHVTDGGAAATGIGDQTAATAAGQLVEGKSSRTINASPSFSVGVDTINSDMMAVFEGVIVVSSTGNIQLLAASEVGASAITVKSGTSLILTKVD